MHAKVLQVCPTLCNPMDCCPPGSAVHGILQARILEWVAAPLPGALPDPGIELIYLHLLHRRQVLYPLNHLGSPSSISKGLQITALYCVENVTMRS